MTEDEIRELERIRDHKPCDGTGWVDDETACGDEEHCSPLTACVCNPNYIDMLTTIFGDDDV